MANFSYQQSGVCPGATSPGQCVEKAIKDITGQEGALQGTEHNTGYFWANNVPGYNGRDSTGCGRIFDLNNAIVQAQLRSIPQLAMSLLAGTNYFLGGTLAKVPTGATAVAPIQRVGQLYVPFPVLLPYSVAILTGLLLCSIHFATWYLDCSQPIINSAVRPTIIMVNTRSQTLTMLRGAQTCRGCRRSRTSMTLLTLSMLNIHLVTSQCAQQLTCTSSISPEGRPAARSEVCSLSSELLTADSMPSSSLMLFQADVK